MRDRGSKGFIASPAFKTEITFLLAAGEGGTPGFLDVLISMLTELFGLIVMVLFLATLVGSL